MNPYIFPVTCDVCGEEGLGNARTAAAEWTVGVRHSDPAVCARNLEIKARKLKEREEELAKKEEELKL